MVSVHLFRVIFFFSLSSIVLQNDRSKDCLDVLKRIHADAQDPEGRFAAREHHAMQQQFALDSTHRGGSYKSLLSERHNLKRVLLGFMVMFGAQCTGTLVINSKSCRHYITPNAHPKLDYGVTLYSNVGYEGRIAIALTAGWVTVSIAGNAITSLFVDKIGRVKFLGKHAIILLINGLIFLSVVIGFGGIVVVLIGEMICLALLETRTSFGLSAAAIFFLFGHIAFFSSCIDATTYIYASEIFPNHLRARGLSLSVSGLFLASLAFTQAASSALATIKWKYYILFAILSSAMGILVLTYFPETKGLSLEEMSKLFGDPVAVDLSTITVDDEIALDIALEADQDKVNVTHQEKV